MSQIDGSFFSSSETFFVKRKAPSLVDLCLGVLGQSLEDIVEDLLNVVASFPSDIKMSLSAIARRKRLLNDDALVALADSSWELLDISSSNVTDIGLAAAAGICSNLQSVDISKCDKVTEVGVTNLFSQCHLLETLRCGALLKTGRYDCRGSPASEATARSCLSIFKLKLESIEEDSWEDLDGLDLSSGAQSLQWLLWPQIDEYSLGQLATECPRISVNPQPSLLGIRGTQVPIAALPHRALDESFVEGIDPKTWYVAPLPRVNSVPVLAAKELSKAEKFRLAFEERDSRLAPKRAKNARQRVRRFQREQLMKDPDVKSVAFAKHVGKDLHKRV